MRYICDPPQSPYVDMEGMQSIFCEMPRGTIILRRRKVNIVIKFAYGNGFHFIGRFRDLIALLSAIEDKGITVREYISNYKQKLN